MKKNLGLKLNWAFGALCVMVSCIGILFAEPEMYVPLALILIGGSAILFFSNLLLMEDEKRGK